MHDNIPQEFKKDILCRTGLWLFILFLAISLLCPFITQKPMDHSRHTFAPPSSLHWLGTNDVGQDIWSRLLWGTRTSLLIAIGAGSLTTCLSALMGISTGFIGGIYDTIMMRLVDALLAIPMIVVLIVSAAFLKPNITILIMLISLLHWPGGARVLRSQTLSLKSRLHILAAETFGAGKLYRIRRHIIPELGPILIVTFLYSARAAVFMEAGLAFIGIADPSMISWGMMMHHASGFYYLSVWKWWLLPPGFTLSLLMLSFTFLGYSLEHIMEPRLKDA